jgi:hypothetical protein
MSTLLIIKGIEQCPSMAHLFILLVDSSARERTKEALSNSENVFGAQNKQRITMNILDVLIKYRYAYQEYGEFKTNEWLSQLCKEEKFPKWFEKEVKRCFDSRGNFIRNEGEFLYEAMLVRKISGVTRS